MQMANLPASTRISGLFARRLPVLGVLTGVLLALTSASIHAQEVPELQTSTGHSRNIDSPLLVKEFGLLFTRDSYGEIKAWDFASGKVLKTWTYTTLYEGLHGPVYLPDRGWVAVCNADGLDLYRASDLTLVVHLPETRISRPHYDPLTKRLYCTSTSPNGLRVLEVDLDALKFKTKPGQFLRLPNTPGKNQLTVYNMLTLSDGRLLLQFGPGEGSALVDPSDWSKVERLPGEQRRIVRGQGEELVAVSSSPGKARIEVLDGRTLAVLRGADIIPATRADTVSGYTLSDFTAPAPGQSIRMIFRGYQHLLLVDAQTLKVTLRIDLTKDFGPKALAVEDLRTLSRNEWLVTGMGAPSIVRWLERRVVRTMGQRTYYSAKIATASEGFRFFISNLNGSSRRIDFTEDGVNIAEFDEQPLAAAYSPDGRHVAFQRYQDSSARISRADEFPRKDRVFNRTNQVKLSDNFNFVFSPDSRLLAALTATTAHVYEVATGRLVFELGGGKMNFSPYLIAGIAAFSTDGKMLAISRVVEREGNKLHRCVQAFDLETGAMRWETPGTFAVMSYSPDGTEIVSMEFEAKTLVRLDAATGAIKSRTRLPEPQAGKPFIRWGLSADQRRLFTVGSKQVAVYEFPSLRLLSVHAPVGKSVNEVAFFARSDFFVTLDGDDLMRIWKVGAKEPLGILTLFGNGRDWCFNTPDFHFQASPAAMSDMYFVKGRSIIPLESLFEQFFTPKLATRLFAGETLQPAIDVLKIKVPPRVTLALDTGTRGLSVEDDIATISSATEQVKLDVEATSPEAAITEIHLYHNGKLVQSTTRGLFVEDDPDALTEKRTFPLTLLPGENTFRAVAINAQRIESIPAELVVKYAPPAGKGASAAVAAAGEKSGGGLQLHFIIVGLNKYRNPRFNLNYAVADATAVREHIEKRAAGIFSKINTHVLFDDQAAKPAIVAAFQQVAAAAGPRDAFIFYYAGHGVMSGEARPKFYLVPYDVTQMYGADEKLASAAISSAELQELSRLIPAQKQLFVLDACQSAGALEAIAVRGAAEQKAIAQLARSSGTHWLTASGSEQFATEFAELGHGAFTYVLLQGLAGKADSGDGRVTVNELKAWLESELPEVTQKHKGTPQFPASYGFGQDFPLTIKN